MRSSFKARDQNSHKPVKEILIRERVEDWIDALIEAGCPPWGEDGKNMKEVKVGWFPEVEELP